MQIDESILQEVVADRQLDLLRLNVEALPAATQELKSAQWLKAATPLLHHSPPYPIVDATISSRLSEIARQVQLSTGAEAVNIVLDEGGQMVCRAKIGNSGPEIDTQVNTHTGLIGSCIRAAAILRCDDSEQDNRADSAACGKLGILSIIYIPVCEQQSVIGVCALLCSRPAAFHAIPTVQLQSIAEAILSVVRGGSVDSGAAAKVVPDTTNHPTAASSSAESELATPSPSCTSRPSGPSGDAETRPRLFPVPQSPPGLTPVIARPQQTAVFARKSRFLIAIIAGELVVAALLLTVGISNRVASAPIAGAGPGRSKTTSASLELIHKTIPAYPESAKEQQIEGDVIIRALIGKDGTVQKVEFVSGPTVFARAAMDAITEWRYRPPYLNGQPTQWTTNITVQFRLH